MKILIYIAALLLALALIILLGAFICFYMAFYNPSKKKIRPKDELPPGKEYEPYYPLMRKWMTERKAMDFKEFSVKSFDGLTLRGRYYEQNKNNPIELMFHGYRGSAERDLCGGIQRCFSLGRNVLIVDQRAHGRSDGNIITFGLFEARDCLSWIELIRKEFGENKEIILCGISMGAATVMQACGEKLPENVIGVLADCGYTSAREIISSVVEKMHLPSQLLYPLIRLGAIIFGGFDPDKANPEAALKNCRLPIMFIHGEADDFVPCEMSHRNFAAVASPKGIFTVPNAGHGAAYLADTEGYLKAVSEFYTKNKIYTEIKTRL